MSKRTLTLGKRRGLSQCATGDGIFNILALDHRQAVKKIFFDRPDPYAEAVSFKRDVVRTLTPLSTAVLLDPSIGAGPCLTDYSLPGSCGLIVTVEASGYEGPSHRRISRLPADWNVGRIKRMGASAVKLLVYYHPQAENAAEMRELVQFVSEECRRFDVALFLEVLTYSPNPDVNKLTRDEFAEAVVQSAADLTPLGADVYKAEFPIDVKNQPDPARWLESCRLLNDASVIPWVILSAGVDYDVFAQQAIIACQAGASGILAGRAIWKEALESPVNKRQDLLTSVGRRRMSQLGATCSQYGRSYREFYATDSLVEDWYTTYADLA